jgi:CRISPR-associated protein (TIGR03984 family)
MARDIYRIKSLKSLVEQGEANVNIKDFVFNKIDRGFVVSWFYNEVLFGKIQNNSFVFYCGQNPDFNKYLIKLRAFNEDEELYLWKGNDKWYYRYRKDDEGNEAWEFIEAAQVMFGTISKDLGNGFCEIREGRGISYIVPKEFLNDKTLSKDARLFLITRNYICKGAKGNEIGQVGFVDNRFVKIEIKGEYA